MKYLKKYNEGRQYSIRSGTVLTDIRNIALDITDEGFRINIVLDSWNGEFGYEDWILTVDRVDDMGMTHGYREYRRKYFELDDNVKDFLLRVIEYGKIGKCDINIFIPDRHHKDKKIEIVPNDHGDFCSVNDSRVIDYRITFVDINISSIRR